MRRHLTIAIVGTVAIALLVAGLGTFALLRRSARAETRAELEYEARSIAASASDLRPQALAGLARALRLEGIAVIRLLPGGEVAGPLPTGMNAADVDFEPLRSGQVISGGDGRFVFAAAPIQQGPRTIAAVVLTRRPTSGVQGAVGWFLLAALLALLAAAAVADRVSRRLATPLRDVERVTRHLAGGDLSARASPSDGAGDEVDSLARSVNAMAEQMERSRNLDRQFLMSVSHELRTPLTSVKGFAEAIADGTEPDSRRAASVISAEARRLERLVGDLLELAKLDARQFSLDVRAVDVAEVLVDTAEGFRPAAEAAGLTLSVPPQVRPVMATADPVRLAQVVANLMENALKHARTSITVGIDEDGDRPQLWVLDDGAGIPTEDAARVFDRLFTGARQPSRQGGSGLGLAIAEELTTAMGGEIRVEPGGSPGARFSVTLKRWS